MSGYVLGVGISVVDIIGKTLGFPERDGYTLLLEHDQQVGGIVSNALVSLARLGVPTMWLGKVGDDDLGRFILEDMEKEGVELQVEIDQDNPTPLSIIIVDSQSGARSICYRPGCSFVYGKPVPRRVLEQAELIHLDGFYPDAALEAAQYGRESGKKVSLDAGMEIPQLEELVRNSHLFIPTRSVAQTLSGEEEMESCLKKLAAMGPETVVVTCGAEGSWGYQGGEIIKVDAIEVEVVDTTGCGDAYHGAFIYGELKGWDLRRKMLFATAYAALKASRLGGRKGLPRREEISQFLKERDLGLSLD